MKRLVIFAAVVLICETAKVPPEVIHQVKAPVPNNVLAPSSISKESGNVEKPAQVMEVVKDEKPITAADKKVHVNEQNVVKPVMPVVVEMKRKIRAVVTTVLPEVKKMTTMRPQIKPVLPITVTEMKRKTRTVMTTVQPEMKTVKPIIVQVTTVRPEVPKADKKSVVMAGEQPETRPLNEMKRKTRAVVTTEQPGVKTVKPAIQIPAVNIKNVIMSTMQPGTKTVMPSTKIEMKRKTRAAVTTVRPEVKLSTTQNNIKSKQLESKTVMPPTVTELKRKTRAVPSTDGGSKNNHNSRKNDVKEQMPVNRMHSRRSMRSLKVEVTTNMPLPTNMLVKSPDSVGSKPKIDPCDLLCTKFEFDPICASNGLCLHEFPNQCILDTFNCKHHKGKFAATKDGSCQMSWLTKCEESDVV